MTATDLKAQLQAELPELLQNRMLVSDNGWNTDPADRGHAGKLRCPIRADAAGVRRRPRRATPALGGAKPQWENKPASGRSKTGKWDEQNRKNTELLEEIKAPAPAGAGHRRAWAPAGGIASEHSFRAALKGILEKKLRCRSV